MQLMLIKFYQHIKYIVINLSPRLIYMLLNTVINLLMWQLFKGTVCPQIIWFKCVTHKSNPKSHNNIHKLYLYGNNPNYWRVAIMAFLNARLYGRNKQSHMFWPQMAQGLCGHLIKSGQRCSGLAILVILYAPLLNLTMGTTSWPCHQFMT